ncbi:YciI family protein [Nonomuraea coxensis]|uniref:YciI family protein n=1 Tax=Nonomuraea coxensis TaxID=404386 RepID=UPI001FE8C374|nr:YciI family protein [Nonomuraea coxensis]
MEFFCHHRDRPRSAALRAELTEEHWSYMDRYEAELIARGPTLDRDGDTATGSVHIVDLPDPAAARRGRRPHRVRAAAVRRRLRLARHGRAGPGGGPGHGPHPADRRPLRRHRGPRLGLRRAAVDAAAHRWPPVTAGRPGAASAPR